ncbi:MAG: tRNA (guanine(46)-N(7))-methyltransferase TrmB [Alphaproteobacteria bacterium]|nr:tRNA (guanine(46)-N(7))-methyltransferase TrmB [Alphaproteobacteria bacterium]
MMVAQGPNPNRFFGRRKGKAIKGSRQVLMERLLPRVALAPPAGALDLTRAFGVAPKAVYLEIGFGGGEHLAELSRRHPDIGFIGAEPFLNGVASLLAHLNGSHLKQAAHAQLDAGRADNVRVWPDDIRLLFPFCADGAFERIYILYPDPWPKARHAGRRFVNPKNIADLHRLLSARGRVIVATDVADYAGWALDQMARSGLFEPENADVHAPPPGWVETRYEKKGLAAGRAPSYLIFRKKKPVGKKGLDLSVKKVHNAIE